MSQAAVPAHLAGYTWRAARPDDIPAIHALLTAVDLADQTSNAGTLANFQREFDDPWSPPDTDSLVVFTPEGEAAAYARVYTDPKPQSEARAFLEGEVHPSQRGRGLEDFLFTWAEALGAQHVQSIAGAQTRLLRAFCFDTQAERMAFLERRGFQPIRRSYRMRRDLRQPLPPVTLPPGLTLVAYRPELDEQMWQVREEAFQDHWGSPPVTHAEWQQFFVQRLTFRPDLSFLVMDGAEAAAMTFNWLSPDENARDGLQQAWIGTLGTRRAWRQRGLASALVAASMRAFRDAGMDFAALGVDTENLTGALRLYERMGFVTFKRSTTFGRYLP